MGCGVAVGSVVSCVVFHRVHVWFLSGLGPISGPRLQTLSHCGTQVWYLRGEVDAKGRPLNSALEVDMDYDTTGGMVPLS